MRDGAQGGKGGMAARPLRSPTGVKSYGGKVPGTEGIKRRQGPMNRTIIDWWAWRSQGSPEAHHRALAACFTGATHPVRLVVRKGGYMGYERSAEIIVGDFDAGLVAWGGDNQKGWTYISINGQGCAWIDDWDRAQQAAYDCGQYEPRRVDIALDTFDSATGYDAMLSAYRRGGFNLSGRPPKCEPMKPERPQDSAIIKVGNRKGDKYLRGYEKGKEQLGPAIAAAIAQADAQDFAWADWTMAQMPRYVNGEQVMVSIWDWWRLELELKPRTAPLPQDVIDRRDQYFAGAYPYLGEVLAGVEPEALIMRRVRGPQLDLALALQTIRSQYGNTLFTAVVAHQGDIGAVWNRIAGKKHNQRLVKAGVLMVGHE